MIFMYFEQQKAQLSARALLGAARAVKKRLTRFFTAARRKPSRRKNQPDTRLILSAARGPAFRITKYVNQYQNHFVK